MNEQNIINSSLSNAEIRDRLDGCQVYAFGAGVSGKIFRETHEHELRIKAFVDNGRYGTTLDGIKVLSLEDMLDERKDEPVVVTTECYALQIGSQLKTAGLTPGEDFFIWDEVGSYHLDEDAKAYIEYNKMVFGETDPNEGSENKVLIPFACSQDAVNVIFAYIGNYFARLHDAEIWAYVRSGRGANTISEPLREVYESFHTRRIVSVELTKEQNNRAESFLEEIWPTIQTMRDWHSIELFGVRIGTTIVQYYLRFEMVEFEYNENAWKPFLRKAIGHAVFWHDFFETYDFSAVILLDKGNYDGFIRDMACAKGIPVYGEGVRLSQGYSQNKAGGFYKFFSGFWDQLSEREKEYGLNWAKRKLQDRMYGKETGAYDYNDISPFQSKPSSFHLSNNDITKIVVCPHIFEEETIQNGYQIFSDYVTWLNHLAKLAQTTEYEWYIKEHPAGGYRDRIFIDHFTKKHPQFKKIPADISPLQLKEEGVTCALTVYGSIGIEYPLIGIPVINAGNNPHISFDFNWNPMTIEEYDELILNIERINERKWDADEPYRSFSMNRLLYQYPWKRVWKVFFEEEEVAIGLNNAGSWKYRVFMERWTENYQQDLWTKIATLHREIDQFEESFFYKEKIDEIVDTDIM